MEAVRIVAIAKVTIRNLAVEESFTSSLVEVEIRRHGQCEYLQSHLDAASYVDKKCRYQQLWSRFQS